MKGLAALSLVLCALGGVACGTTAPARLGSHQAATALSPTAATNRPQTGPGEPGVTTPEAKGPVFDAHLTGDEDTDASRYIRGLDDDDAYLLRLGPAAKPAVRAAITGLLERYFGALASEQDPLACSLMTLTLEDLLRETYRQTSRSQTTGRGMTCAAILTNVFAGRHLELLDQSRRMRVAAVRVNGERAVAVLRFAPRLLRRIAVEREGGEWKMSMLQTATLG